MLELRHLHTLATVVETGSVKAAAERLGYTSSAVSQHVNRLEEQAGTQLLEPAGRGIRPTAAALLLAEHGTELVERAGAAEAAVAALVSGRAGVLRMASFATAGAELVPPALAELHRQLPDLEINLKVAEREDALTGLRNGVLDLVVIEDHGDGRSARDDLTSVRLLDDAFHLVLPRRHRLAAKRTVRLAEAMDEPWVHIRCEIGCCRAATDAAFAGAEFEPRRVVEADDYWPAQGFVAAGLGLALIPGLALGVHHRGVTTRRLRRADQPHREVHAVTRPALASAAPIQAMIAALKRRAERQASS
jgi:DNA-binding transcriptional LysR family regulator